jgi:hypothetical protein
MFAKIENNSVVEYPIPNIRQKFPNICFPVILSDSDMPDNYVIIRQSKLPEFGELQKVIELTPIYIENTWVQNFVVVDMDEAEVQQYKDSLAEQVRVERNSLLAKTDIEIIKAYENGIPASSDLKTYRQQLRDITLQEGFPLNVVWPNK